MSRTCFRETSVTSFTLCINESGSPCRWPALDHSGHGVVGPGSVPTLAGMRPQRGLAPRGNAENLDGTFFGAGWVSEEAMRSAPRKVREAPTMANPAKGVRTFAKQLCCEKVTGAGRSRSALDQFCRPAGHQKAGS